MYTHNHLSGGTTKLDLEACTALNEPDTHSYAFYLELDLLFIFQIYPPWLREPDYQAGVRGDSFPGRAHFPLLLISFPCPSFKYTPVIRHYGLPNWNQKRVLCWTSSTLPHASSFDIVFLIFQIHPPPSLIPDYQAGVRGLSSAGRAHRLCLHPQLGACEGDQEQAGGGVWEGAEGECLAT